jgi:hypothetical protein
MQQIKVETQKEKGKRVGGILFFREKEWGERKWRYCGK